MKMYNIYLRIGEHLLRLDDAPVDVLHEGLGVHRLLARRLLRRLLRLLGGRLSRLQETLGS